MRPSTIRAFTIGMITGAALTGALWTGFEAIDAAHNLTTTASPEPWMTAPVTEDDPGWDCATMGDQVCGPGNETGSWPGLYEHGNLVQPWPVDSTDQWLRGPVHFGSGALPGPTSQPAPVPVPVQREGNR